jgi:hypothetical protein
MSMTDLMSVPDLQPDQDRKSISQSLIRDFVFASGRLDPDVPGPVVFDLSDDEIRLLMKARVILYAQLSKAERVNIERKMETLRRRLASFQDEVDRGVFISRVRDEIS